jgi:branched-chain amino acid transport system substrate-binding protein
MRKLIGVVAVALVAFACGGGGGNNQASGSKQTFKIGVSADITGATKTGQPYLDGFNAYFRYVNSHGGLDGHQVTVVSSDDQNLAQQGIADVKKFAEQDQVQLIAFGGLSVPFQAAKDLIPGYKIPVIDVGASVTDLVPAKPYIYSIGSGSVGISTVAQVAWASGILKGAAGKIGIISAAGPSQDAWVAQLTKDAAPKNFTIVTDQTYPLTATDISAQVAALLRAKPDVVISSAGPDKYMQLILDGIRAQAPSLPVLASYSVVYAENLQRNDSNFYWIDLPHIDTSSTAEGVKTYVTATKAAGVDPANVLTEVGYKDAVGAGEALRKCGEGCTGEKLENVMERLTYDNKGLDPKPAVLSSSNHIAISEVSIWNAKSGKIVQAFVYPMR